MWLWRQHVLFSVGDRTLTQDLIWLSWEWWECVWVLRSSSLNSHNTRLQFSHSVTPYRDIKTEQYPSQEFIHLIMKTSDMKSSREGPQYLADVFTGISNNCKVYCMNTICSFKAPNESSILGCHTFDWKSAHCHDKAEGRFKGNHSKPLSVSLRPGWSRRPCF